MFSQLIAALVAVASVATASPDASPEKFGACSASTWIPTSTTVLEEGVDRGGRAPFTILWREWALVCEDDGRELLREDREESVWEEWTPTPRDPEDKGVVSDAPQKVTSQVGEPPAGNPVIPHP
jgi:hypothetical protein